jgi:hypothetical protein
VDLVDCLVVFEDPRVAYKDQELQRLPGQPQASLKPQRLAGGLPAKGDLASSWVIWAAMRPQPLLSQVAPGHYNFQVEHPLRPSQK